MNNNNFQEGLNLSNVVLNGSLIARIIGVYLWVYIFVTFLALLAGGDLHTTYFYKIVKSFTFGLINTQILICSIPAFLMIALFEFFRYRYSKKNNLPRWKDTLSELTKREFEKQKQESADFMKKMSSFNSETDKEDSLDYWFSLKQKGAITEDEYEKKKLVLLSK